MVFLRLLRATGNEGTQVAVGTGVLLTLGAIPWVMRGNTKKGHEYFSSEKPQAIEEAQQKMKAKLLEDSIGSTTLDSNNNKSNVGQNGGDAKK